MDPRPSPDALSTPGCLRPAFCVCAHLMPVGTPSVTFLIVFTHKPMTITGTNFINLGLPEGPIIGRALKSAKTLVQSDDYEGEAEVLRAIRRAWDDPEAVLTNDDAHPALHEVAEAARKTQVRLAYRTSRAPFDEPQDYAVWGGDLIDEGAHDQMKTAMRLPVARLGALMPDAHVGYGLPIGGVFALENAVSPYAVGVDIACRMMVSVYRKEWREVNGMTEKLASAIQEETAFGSGSGFRKPRSHDVMEDPRWNELPLVGRLKNRARHQLGSSGGGNHFVEWGVLTLNETVDTHYGSLPPGEYVALMSHSGSRGLGHQICQHYKEVAQERCYGLPKDMRHLSWLSLDEQSGQDYWHSMQLAGDYASATHHLIHHHVARAAGLKSVWEVENHHNFAWKEEHDVDGEPATLVVHRKGATPADEGTLGIIPGSMADIGAIVRGKGVSESLRSCSHGAGRLMSRTDAKRTFTRSEQKAYLAERDVTLLSGGLDEAPMVYKSIEDVLKAQSDLVDVVATFQPKIVKMSN